MEQIVPEKVLMLSKVVVTVVFPDDYVCDSLDAIVKAKEYLDLSFAGTWKDDETGFSVSVDVRDISSLALVKRRTVSPFEIMEGENAKERP